MENIPVTPPPSSVDKALEAIANTKHYLEAQVVAKAAEAKCSVATFAVEGAKLARHMEQDIQRLLRARNEGDARDALDNLARTSKVLSNHLRKFRAAAAGFKGLRFGYGR